jgi:regulator of sirC expression with transglutaminase-like and TPR domain
VQSPTEQKLIALLRLLDDRDVATRTLAEKSLAAMDPSVFEQLRAASDLIGPDEARRIEELAHILPRRGVLEDLNALVRAGGDHMDLEAGLWCLARLRDPELVTAPYTQELERLAKAVGERLGQSPTPFQALRNFIQVLFQDEGFRGNDDDYYDPDNSFFHKVLERRRGIPISLSALCLLVGGRLELPFVGISLPGHFICGFQAGERAVYFDPFGGGRLLTKEGCESLCRKMGFDFSETYLNPCTSRDILARMARNLREIYFQKEALLELSVLEEFLTVLSQGLERSEKTDETLDDEDSGEVSGETR